MAKGTVYPKDFYVIVDDRNGIRFYDEDPFRLENAEDKDIDFGQKLFEEYGIGDVRNPLVIRVLGTVIHRAEDFNSMKMMKALGHNSHIHIEDAEGNTVEVLPQQNTSDYPINGVLMSPSGDVLAHRKYSNDGECEDGRRSHRLVIVKDEDETRDVGEEMDRQMSKGR